MARSSRFVRENGGETVAIEFFPLDVTNFGPTINKIQQAKPDMVFSGLVGGAHVSFYRQYAAAGMNAEIPIASTTFGIGNEHKLISAEEGNGLLAAYSYFEGVQNAENEAFLARMDAKFGANRATMNELTVRSYEGAMLWAEAVKLADSIEHAEVSAALKSGLTYNGPSGPITIDPQTNHAIQNVVLGELQDQEFNIVASYEAEPPADTQLVCDLNADPTLSTFYFENGLAAAGID